MLRWPEVDRHVAAQGAAEIYVRYRIRDLALDNFRLAVEKKGAGASDVEVTHVWLEDGVEKRRTMKIASDSRGAHYSIEIPSTAKVVNQAVIFEAK